jgi:hypothetical protein
MRADCSADRGGEGPERPKRRRFGHREGSAEALVEKRAVVVATCLGRPSIATPKSLSMIDRSDNDERHDGNLCSRSRRL